MSKTHSISSEILNQTVQLEQLSHHNFSLSNLNGAIQRVRPKREAIVSKTKVDRVETKKKITDAKKERTDFKSESEEFDSDEHVDNTKDWHDELDVVKMPHLLGPSATMHSPVPLQYQHYSFFSAPPFSCQQILVQFTNSGPTFSLVPCSHQPYNYYDYYKSQFPNYHPF